MVLRKLGQRMRATVEEEVLTLFELRGASCTHEAERGATTTTPQAMRQTDRTKKNPMISVVESWIIDRRLSLCGCDDTGRVCVGGNFRTH